MRRVVRPESLACGASSQVSAAFTQARIDKNCILNVCVNIGHNYKGETPVVGDNCFIAPRVKMFSWIVIGDNVKIRTNAVVNKSFSDSICSRELSVC